MTITSLLVLLFIILPGFIADTIARASFGDKKLTDFERTVRSLIYSVAGLFTYMLLAGAINAAIWRLTCHDRWLLDSIKTPPYLAAVSDPTGKTGLRLDGFTALVFVIHTTTTISVAVFWSWLTSRQFVLSRFADLTGRALGGTTWILFWTRFFSIPKHLKGTIEGPRWVTVQLSTGRRIMGQFQAATDTPDEDNDLVLAHPWFWDATRADWYAENVRYLYIPAKQIEYVMIAPIGDQEALSGYKSEIERQREVTRDQKQ